MEQFLYNHKQLHQKLHQVAFNHENTGENYNKSQLKESLPNRTDLLSKENMSPVFSKSLCSSGTLTTATAEVLNENGVSSYAGGGASGISSISCSSGYEGALYPEGLYSFRLAEKSDGDG